MLAYTINRLLLTLTAFGLFTALIWALCIHNGNADLQVNGNGASYFVWLNHMLHGQFGVTGIGRVGSRIVFAPIAAQLQAETLSSLLLFVPAFILAGVLTLALSLLSIARPGGWFDRIFASAIFTGSAMPAFWLALVFVEYLCIKAHLFPYDLDGLVNLRVIGYQFGSPAYWTYFHTHTAVAVQDLASHLSLPVITLVVATLPADSQIVRAAMLEVIGQDYMRSAKARGIRSRRLLWKHALRNAMLPLLAYLSAQIPRFIFLAALIEFVFHIPGIGADFCNTIFIDPNRVFLELPVRRFDPLIIAYTMLLAGISFVTITFAELLTPFIDPRVRR